MPNCKTILIAAAMSLTACGTTNFSASPADFCPPVIFYSAAEQIGAAAELETLGPNAALRRMIEDYATLRRQLRACHAL